MKKELISMAIGYLYWMGPGILGIIADKYFETDSLFMGIGALLPFLPALLIKGVYKNWMKSLSSFGRSRWG